MDIVFKKDVGKKKKNFTLKRIDFLKNIDSLFYYFLGLLLVGVLFYSTALFTNYFTTPFSGDYTSQEFAFYTNGWDDWWHFLTTGEFVLFDSNTFLGVNNIGSNSFYYLFSPFFLPILLCPRQLIPQGMAILTIFKNAGAGMIFYAYMRYLGVSKRSSKVAGLAYGFSGWMAWYLWFNHFTDVTLVFPLILLGIEKVLKEKKPWVLMGAVCVGGFTNFFFLVCFLIAGFLYAMFRFFQGVKNHTVKDNFIILGIGFFAFSVGILMSCMVLLPAALVSLQAPRAQETSYLDILKEAVKNKEWSKFFSYIFSWSDLTIRSKNVSERVYFSLIDFIFPVASDRGTPLVVYSASYDNVAGSLFVYYPFILLLVPALIKSTREKHFSPLIATALLTLMTFTPFCYYMFHGFTKEPYSRWSIFITTSIIAYVGKYLDKIKEDKNWPLIAGLGTTIAMIVAATIISYHLITIDNAENSELPYTHQYTFTSRSPISFAWIAVIASVYVCIVYVLIRIWKNKSYLYRILFGLITFESAIMGFLTIQGHGLDTYVKANMGLENNNALRQVVEKVNKEDKGYFRCYSTLGNERARNDSMRNGYNGLGFFHSIYNYDMANFLNWSRINDYDAPSSWAGSYIEKRISADAMLGVKYYYVLKEDISYLMNNGDKRVDGENPSESYDGSSPNFRANVPLGYVNVSDKYPNSRFYVYENKNFIDFGYSFDVLTSYNDEENLDSKTLKSRAIDNESLYLRFGILDYNDAQEIIGEHADLTFKDKDLIDIDLTRLYIYENPSYGNYRVTYYDITGEDENDKKTKSYQLPYKSILEINRDNHDEYPIVSFPGTGSEFKDRYITIIDKPMGDFEYDPDGMIFYLDNCFDWDYRINVYFVDENNHIITYDDHNDQHMYQNNTWYKTWRGYYIAPKYDENGIKIEDAPKIDRIIIVNKGKYLQNHSLSYESYTNYQSKLNVFNEYKIENVKYSTNKFTFETNFEKERFIVSQVPYDVGWKIKATFEDGTHQYLKTFNGQGGFTSFVAPKGSVKYSMTYYTPYLKIGSLLSALGAACFLFTFIGYYYILTNIEKRKAFKEFLRKPNN